MYSGYVVGGPMHGQRHIDEHPRFAVAEAMPVGPEVGSLDAMIALKVTDHIKHHDYIHTEEYTEMGQCVRIWLWLPAANLAQGLREEFLRCALDGAGVPRKVTALNRNQIYPGAPDGWNE